MAVTDHDAEQLVMPRLLAGTWSPDDAEAAHALYGDPRVVRHIGNDLMADVAATRVRLERVLAKCALYPAGMGGFALRERDTRALVGAALIKPLPDADGEQTSSIEIGWHLAHAHWGKGYATEAGRALLAWGFEQLELEELHAVTEPSNLASQAVALRLGMHDRDHTDAYYGVRLRHFTLDRDSWHRRGSAAGVPEA